MIHLRYYAGHHQGGTKEYHLYLLTSPARTSHILVKRWGKIGADGQSKVMVGRNSGETELTAALDERLKKGYDMSEVTSARSSNITVEQALKWMPPSIRRSLTNAQLATIDPANFQQGDRSTYDPLADERKKLVEKQMEENRRAEEESVSAALKSNPMFGMF